MISGFVILWSAQGKDLLEFAVSRITRLYPTFWICVCLAAIAELSLGNHVTPFTLANLTIYREFRQPAKNGSCDVEALYGQNSCLRGAADLRKTTAQYRSLAGWLADCNSVDLMGPIWVTSITPAPWSALFIGGCNLISASWSRGWNGSRAAGLVGAFFLSLSAGMNSQESGVQVPSDALQAFAIVVIYAMMATLALRWWRLPHTSLWLTLGSVSFPLHLVHSRPARAWWNAIDLPDICASVSSAVHLSRSRPYWHTPSSEGRAVGSTGRCFSCFGLRPQGKPLPVSKTAKRA